MSLLLSRIAARHEAIRDPYWSQVAALLPLTADFADATGRVWTPNGNIAITGGAATMDGAGDYLTTPNGSDFGLNASDFTFESFCAPADLNKVHTISANRSLASTVSGYVFEISTTGVKLVVWNASGVVANLTSSGMPVAGSRQYIAFSKQGTTAKISVGGVVTTGTFTGTPAAGTTAYIGRDPGNTANDYAGLIDSVRITVGVARDISRVPPTPFPTA